jgi:putative ABC transport system ATP-binding protein
MSAILQFKNVSKVFPGLFPVHALTEVSFSLPQSCFAAVVGVSGSGKSTLLNIASGIDSASDGEVWVGDQNITRLGQKSLSLFRRDHLGFVFQSFNLFPTLTVIENVEYTMLIGGKNRKLSRERALESLESVGLIEKAQFFPQKLSGGQQQRVAVARAIASDPKIILADEPTANLDYGTAQLLIDLFQTLNQKRGMNFLFSTHDRELIKSVDLVVNLKSGRLV